MALPRVRLCKARHDLKLTRGGFIVVATVRIAVPRPIKSGLEFEAAFPKKGWSYDPKDAASYVDIYGLDPRDSYTKVRAGEWAEGRVICFGFLKRVRARRISSIGPVLGSGTRLVGAVRVDSRVEIDFGFFRSELAFASEEERQDLESGSPEKRVVRRH